MLPDLHTEPTLTVERAAEVLGISRASAYRAVHDGTLPALRFGKSIRIPTADLLRLLGADRGRGDYADPPGLSAVR